MSDAIAEFARILGDHRRAGTQIEQLADDLAPQSLDEAYLVQRLVADQVPGGTCGWKIGMTNRAAMQARGVESPVYARLFTATTSRTGSIALPAVGGRQILEAEYVFELQRDLPPGDYSRADLIAAIGAVRPGIEVCGSRFSTTGPLALPVSLADNSFHLGLVVGEPLSEWQDRYLTEPVVIDFDNGQSASGNGQNVLDDPLIPLAWLASAALPGGGLRAGDLIASGAAATLVLATAKGKGEARFGHDGTVFAELVERK